MFKIPISTMKTTNLLLSASLALPLMVSGASVKTAPLGDSGSCLRPCDSNVTIGKKLPEKTPSYVEVYPGAEIAFSGVEENEGIVNGSLSLSTNDSFEKVVAFYKASLEKSGIKPVSSFSSDNTQILAADDGEKAYGVSINGGADGTVVTIAFRK